MHSAYRTGGTAGEKHLEKQHPQATSPARDSAGQTDLPHERAAVPEQPLMVHNVTLPVADRRHGKLE